MFALTLADVASSSASAGDEPWLSFNREEYLREIADLPMQVAARLARGNTSLQNREVITQDDLDRDVEELEAQLACRTN